MIGGLIIILAAGLFLLAFIGLASHKKPRKQIAGKDLNPNYVYVEWQHIKELLSSQTPSAHKTALIDADKLLDYVLKGRGYSGDTMAERLKRASDHIKNREAVWRAHKLRNALVHEHGIDQVPSQIEAAVAAIGKAIKDLGVTI